MNTLRGHPIYQGKDEQWYFCDTNEPTVDNWIKRPCGYCGEYGNSNDGLPDPCLGNLAGVTNACCGHGDPSQAYIVFMGGLVIRGFNVDEFAHREIEKEEAAMIIQHNQDRWKFTREK